MKQSIYLLFTLLALGAQAQVTGSATLTTPPPALASPLRIDYFGDLNVPAKKSEAGDWYHEPGLTYKMELASLKLKVPFKSYASPNERNHTNEMEDVSVGVARTLVTGDLFSLYGSASLLAPNSDDSKMKQRRGALGWTLIPASTFGTTNLKLEWLTLIKHYGYVQNDQLSAKNRGYLDSGRMSQHKVEMYPTLTYFANDRLGATFGGHLNFYQNRNRALTEWVRTKNAVHLGFSYKVAKELSIRPELRFMDPSDVRGETTEAGMLFFSSL